MISLTKSIQDILAEKGEASENLYNLLSKSEPVSKVQPEQRK